MNSPKHYLLLLTFFFSPSTCTLVLIMYGTEKNGFFLLPTLMLVYALKISVTVVESSFQAHGTFVCGENGGGVAEEFNCEKEVDICIGTLSKATGCYGGFIACR